MASYYDVDAILTDAQKVPCTFELDVPGLGFVEGNAGGNLKKGTKVELPLWLAEMLAVSQSLDSAPMATIDMPPSLNARVLNALKADPKTVDLRAQAAHFYKLGARMLDLFEDDDMTDVLLTAETDSPEMKTFKTRAIAISDHASNPRGALGEGAEFMRGLDDTERQLFRAAHDSSKATKVWLADVKKD